MEFTGLTIEDNGSNNVIEIDDSAIFKRSKIVINGNNNVVKLKKTLSYTNFVVNLKGDNKLINVEGSNKNINGLKFVSIRGNNQKFKIGENFSCGGLEVQMNDGNETCIIGDDCLFSWGIKIRTSDGHSIIDLESNKAINLPRDVYIADRVWVGEDVSFLKGVIISEDCVVGSRSVVTKKFTCNNCIIAGFPALVVKENIKWDRRMPSEYNRLIE